MLPVSMPMPVVAFFSARPEMVDCSSDQGSSVFESAGAVRLRRGFQKRENADMGCKMPFMDGHYLINMWTGLPAHQHGAQSASAKKMHVQMPHLLAGILVAVDQ